MDANINDLRPMKRPVLQDHGQDLLLSCAASFDEPEIHEKSNQSFQLKIRPLCEIQEHGIVKEDVEQEQWSIDSRYGLSFTKPKKKYVESRQRYKKKVAAIKAICNAQIDQLKSLVPGLDKRVDRSGALEMTVKYIISLQSNFGGSMEHEFKRFLIQECVP